MRPYHMLEKAVSNNPAAAVLLPYCIYARDRYMLLRRPVLDMLLYSPLPTSITNDKS